MGHCSSSPLKFVAVKALTRHHSLDEIPHEMTIDSKSPSMR
jgi:hypothetical protein